MSERKALAKSISLLLDIVQNPRASTELDQFLGDYCHQCRNRLNSLKLSIYLAKRQSPQGVGQGWKTLEKHYQELEDQLGRLHKLASPLSLSPVVIGLDLLFDDRRAVWSEIMARSHRELEFSRSCAANTAKFDAEQMGSALDALITWRAEQGGSATKAMIRWWVDAEEAHIKWYEFDAVDWKDPGCAASVHAIWILPILARVVTAHGGRIDIAEQCGWTLTISWPRHSS